MTSDFLAGIKPSYDHVLIVGDSNIHVCCPDKLLVKDFLSLSDSSKLVQCVSCPTHQHGHTPGLVLAYGLPVSHCDSGLCLFYLMLVLNELQLKLLLGAAGLLTLPLSSLLLLISFMFPQTFPPMIQRSSAPGLRRISKPAWILWFR